MFIKQCAFHIAHSGPMVSWIFGPGFEPGNFLWEKFDDFCCVVEEKDSGWLCGLADLRFQQDVSLEKHNISIQDQGYFDKVVRTSYLVLVFK